MSADPAPSDNSAVPPGQQIKHRLLVTHYGPIPRAQDPSSWTMDFAGNTASGDSHRLTVGELGAMTRTRVIADLHCGKNAATNP
jgi:hypothetical protein